MSRLNRLFQALGEDARLEREFEQDADGVMFRYDLGDEEKAALREGDVDRLRAMSGVATLSLGNSTVKSYA